MPSRQIVTHLQVICQCKHSDDLTMMDVLIGMRIVPDVFTRISNARMKSDNSGGWLLDDSQKTALQWETGEL